MKGIVNISATVDIPNNANLECRLDAKADIEVTLGTWEGSVELLFERYALERFIELATHALNEPIRIDPKAPPAMFVSPPNEIHEAEANNSHDAPS